MKLLQRISLSLLLLLICFGTATAQRGDKLTKKAERRIEKINAQIAAGDPALALNEAQTATAMAIYVGLFGDLKTIKKKGGDRDEQKAEMKEARSAANKLVMREVLTDEQRKARRAGKKE